MDGIGGKGIARGKSNSPDWIDRAPIFRSTWLLARAIASPGASPESKDLRASGTVAGLSHYRSLKDVPISFRPLQSRLEWVNL